MLTQCSHISRKRGIYYYRRRLPKPHKGDVAVSLRTKGFREAEHLATVLDHSFDHVTKNNKKMTTPDLQAILRQYLKGALEADLEQHHAAKPGKPVYTSNVEEHTDPIDADLGVIEYLLDDYREWLARREIKHTEPALNRLMTEHQLAEDHRVPLGLGLLQANIQVMEKAKERIMGATEPILLEPQAAPAPTIVAAEPNGPLLSEVLPDFLDFMMKDESWRGQTLAQNTATYRMFKEHCGDKPVQAYSRKELTPFYDVLRHLPALWSKKAEWRDLPLAEIVKRTQGEDIERLTMRTVKRHFSALGRLFTYLKRRGEYEGENPAHGFEFPSKGRANKKRQMWEGESLTKLFTSPVWTGCFSSDRRSRPGTTIIKDEKYWLPILGLYHGNRLEEFAQLHRSDLKQQDGIWYFDINDEGSRQVKNDQSIRRVPVHPAVEALGFLEYAEATAPAPGDRLFPKLKPGGPDAKLGYYFTKWWSQYRRDVGVYEKRLDYHSFRHGVTTKLYAADVSSVIVDELTGHEGEGTSQVVYKKDMPLSKLHKAIRKVEWVEVCFRP